MSRSHSASSRRRPHGHAIPPAGNRYTPAPRFALRAQATDEFGQRGRLRERLAAGDGQAIRLGQPGSKSAITASNGQGVPCGCSSGEMQPFSSVYSRRPTWPVVYPAPVLRRGSAPGIFKLHGRYPTRRHTGTRYRRTAGRCRVTLNSLPSSISPWRSSSNMARASGFSTAVSARLPMPRPPEEYRCPNRHELVHHFRREFHLHLPALAHLVLNGAQHFALHDLAHHRRADEVEDDDVLPDAVQQLRTSQECLKYSARRRESCRVTTS